MVLSLQTLPSACRILKAIGAAERKGLACETVQGVRVERCHKPTSQAYQKLHIFHFLTCSFPVPAFRPCHRLLGQPVPVTCGASANSSYLHPVLCLYLSSSPCTIIISIPILHHSFLALKCFKTCHCNCKPITLFDNTVLASSVPCCTGCS